MKRNWLGFDTCFYDMPDATGGAGGVGAGDGGAPAAATDSPAEPSVIDLADDSLVKWPGSDKPTKFKDIRNFQSQWTREAQRRSAVEKQLAEERALRQRYEQERQQAGQRQTQGQEQPDVLAQLESLPYLSGQDAQRVVQNILGQIQQRDQVTMQLARQMAAMKQQLSTVYDSHSTSAFDGKIDKWLTEGGYAPEFRDLAKEIYLAYEGDDLDYEFPRIFAERVEQIEKAFDAKRRQAVDRNRQNRFVPGKGGVGAPNKPMQFKGDESARDIADQLFSTFSESGT